MKGRAAVLLHRNSKINTWCVSVGSPGRGGGGRRRVVSGRLLGGSDTLAKIEEIGRSSMKEEVWGSIWGLAGTNGQNWL